MPSQKQERSTRPGIVWVRGRSQAPNPDALAAVTRNKHKCVRPGLLRAQGRGHRSRPTLSEQASGTRFSTVVLLLRSRRRVVHACQRQHLFATEQIGPVAFFRKNQLARGCEAGLCRRPSRKWYDRIRQYHRGAIGTLIPRPSSSFT
jgi:hypothetical protein